MSEAAPNTSAITPGEMLDPAAQWRSIVDNYDAVAPAAPSTIEEYGAANTQLAATTEGALLQPAAESDPTPAETAEPAAPEPETPGPLTEGDMALEALKRITRTDETVGKIAKRLGITPGGEEPEEPEEPLNGSGLEWGYAGRLPYGHDPYSRVVQDPTAPGGERLVVEPGRISSRDKPRALNPRGTRYKYYGVPEWQRIKNADAKGEPEWAPGGPSREGRYAWGTDRWPFWQHLGFRLRKLGTNLIPGGWYGDDWRGQSNRLVDYTQDLYTPAEVAAIKAKDPNSKVAVGQLKTRVVGRRTFRNPRGADYTQTITVPDKSGPRMRTYYSRAPSFANPSSNESF